MDGSFCVLFIFFAEKFGKSEIIRIFATNHWRMASAEVAGVTLGEIINKRLLLFGTLWNVGNFNSCSI